MARIVFLDRRTQPRFSRTILLPCAVVTMTFLCCVSWFQRNLSSSGLKEIAIAQSEMDTQSQSIFDPVRTTAFQLQELLISGKITSSDAIDRYISRIQKHDAYLHAIIHVSPFARELAKTLDEERAHGHVRGPLHGIPILVKDNIASHPSLGMNTTAGSFALKGSICEANAPIVQQLIDAGAIILAKTQLAEFALYKGVGLTQGWSAVVGQAESAYTRGNVDPSDGIMGHSNPGGSSTGSAVGVSVGYAPLSIGTDTKGSIIVPATRAALFSLKFTKDLVSLEGIVPVSKTFDSLGPMAKSVRDLAMIMNVIVKKPGPAIPYNFDSSASWSQLRIGFLDPDKWHFDAGLSRPNEEAGQQIIQETKKAYKKIKSLAQSCEQVELISDDQLSLPNGNGLFDIFEADFKADIEEYLAGLKTSDVRTLDDVIRFNKDKASMELPRGNSNQDLLIAASRNTVLPTQRSELLWHVRNVGRDRGIDKTLHDNNIDVIISPADSAFNLIGCASGYPSATMPLSYLDFNGRPFGLFALGTAGSEQVLLDVLAAWENTFLEEDPHKGIEHHQLRQVSFNMSFGISDVTINC